MSALECIQAGHLNRLAIVYVRQSTPHQAAHHQESLRLQYGLVERARACGWEPDRIRVLDADLGRSGRTTDGRPGFQELVTLVTLEHVGILFAYDVTRLARNCTDWYQLLDLCGCRQCLVGDQDGIYDPAVPNGRLILGLKGLISELELHTLRRRMTDGLLQKARRGELSQRLPAGLERDPLGQVVKHPDQEVQGRLALVFDTFLRLGAMSRVVRFFNHQGLRLPRIDPLGDIVWRPATTQAVYAILQNPAYAGAYARGRRCGATVAGKRVVHRVPRPQWPICVRDKYPAYIDWTTFEKIQAMLQDNYSDYQDKQSRGIPRSGTGLVAGIVYCGECGHKMTVHYGSGVHYACDFLRTKYQSGPSCQRVTATPIDEHVARAFLDALTPAEQDAYAEALSLMQREATQVRQARQQQIDRLRYQAQLAERQFSRSDPDNRLVSAELERRWETALRDLRTAEEAWQQESRDPATPSVLDPETRQSVEEAGLQITRMWQENQLGLARQKALLRCLVDKVVVRRLTVEAGEVRVVWKGGDVTTAVVPLPTASWSGLSAAGKIEEDVVRLARQGKTDREIAGELTRQGCRSPRTSGVSAHMVLRIRLRRRVLRDRTPKAPAPYPAG